MSVIFRLYQEGNIRTNGFQATEWVDSNISYTTPAYSRPFVLHQSVDGYPEFFVRVATPIDFGNLNPNPLIGFDLKGPFTTFNSYPNTGDTLRLKVDLFPHWQTNTAINGVAYTLTGDGYMEFPILNFSSFRGRNLINDAPTIVTANRTVIADHYNFTEEDVGRIITLTGFSNSTNNQKVMVLSVQGGMAITNANPVFITELNTFGASWALNRVTVNTLKPFPRIEGNISWQVRSLVDGTISLASDKGAPMRFDPTTKKFRDDRVTTVYATIEEVKNHFASVQTYLQNLKEELSAVDGSFGSVGPYDY